MSTPTVITASEITEGMFLKAVAHKRWGFTSAHVADCFVSSVAEHPEFDGFLQIKMEGGDTFNLTFNLEPTRLVEVA